MTSDGTKQPPWIAPRAHSGVKLPNIKIYNSLTRNKDDFIPADPKGQTVTWYACGPTVYEDAHLGHAKTYVSTDIIRRIMRDYFGLRIKFVMNTIDLDDKIITKDRQQYLLARFKQEHITADDYVDAVVLSETNLAFQQYISKNLPTLHSGTTFDTFATAVAQTYKEDVQPSSAIVSAHERSGEAVSIASLPLRAHIATARSAAEALQTPRTLSEFFAKTDDILLAYLDALYGADMDSDDHKTYLDWTQRFERRFFEDMSALNVLEPDQSTRVTEYVPQIVSFVEKIVAS
jgi:cysteinyl-tRNA synthetase